MSLLALVVTIVSSVILNGISSNPGYLVVFGQTNQVNSSAKNTVNLHGIETNKVHVGDIDIAYKMFGKGNPILLINGFCTTRFLGSDVVGETCLKSYGNNI
jgi:hypothetical protein